MPTFLILPLLPRSFRLSSTIFNIEVIVRLLQHASVGKHGEVRASLAHGHLCSGKRLSQVRNSQMTYVHVPLIARPRGLADEEKSRS